MYTLLDTSEVAETIIDFYHERFGGKEKGRYQITRNLFKEMSGRMILSNEFLIDLKEHLYCEGYTLLDLEGDSFIVMPTKILKGYRKLTTAMVNNFIAGRKMDEAEEEAKDNEKQKL